jgi:hypothetical protein
MTKLIVLLTGYKCCGKTTIARSLERNYSFKCFSFANGVKEKCAELLGTPGDITLFVNRDTKEKYRPFLKTTSEFYRKDDEYFFIRQLCKQIEDDFHELIVIDDLRLTFEPTFIKEYFKDTAHVVIARIHRNDITLDPKDTYEQFIDNFKPDYSIYNNEPVDKSCRKLINKIYSV